IRDDLVTGVQTCALPICTLPARSNPQVFDMRALVLVLDSFGIGGAPDAAAYGDAGADTLGHIAAACARGEADNEERAGPIKLPKIGRASCRGSGGDSRCW